MDVFGNRLRASRSKDARCAGTSFSFRIRRRASQHRRHNATISTKSFVKFSGPIVDTFGFKLPLPTFYLNFSSNRIWESTLSRAPRSTSRGTLPAATTRSRPCTRGTTRSTKPISRSSSTSRGIKAMRFFRSIVHDQSQVVETWWRPNSRTPAFKSKRSRSSTPTRAA